MPVVAAIVKRADRYLVGLRPAGERHEGLWEFPGGKVRPGESFLDALDRELQEELGVAVSEIAEPLFSALDSDSAFVIHFVPTTIVGDPRCIEHPEIRWVRESEFTELQLAPPDTRFVALKFGDGRGSVHPPSFLP